LCPAVKNPIRQRLPTGILLLRSTMGTGSFLRRRRDASAGDRSAFVQGVEQPAMIRYDDAHT